MSPCSKALAQKWGILHSKSNMDAKFPQFEFYDRQTLRTSQSLFVLLRVRVSIIISFIRVTISVVGVNETDATKRKRKAK